MSIRKYENSNIELFGDHCVGVKYILVCCSIGSNFTKASSKMKYNLLKLVQFCCSYIYLNHYVAFL